MGLFDSILGGGGGGSEVGFAGVPESEEVKKSRERLFELASGEPPDVPLRKRAPYEPIEFEKFPEQQDFMQLPEVQGIIQETKAGGDLLTNRLARMLQSAGSLTATSGRDVLGRAVTDVQKSLASSLAPFGLEQRALKERQFGVERAFDVSEQARRMGITEAEYTDRYQKELTESQQLQSFTIPLLQNIIGNQPAVQPYMTGGAGQTSLGGLSDILGPILAASMGGGGGATGGGGTSGGGGGGITGGGTSGDVQMAMQLAMMFSDENLKTDIKSIPSALDKIKQLDGKTFKFINGTESGGVIAQEIEKIMPEAVGERDGFKTVDYTAILGLLINAVKELARKAG